MQTYPTSVYSDRHTLGHHPLLDDCWINGWKNARMEEWLDENESSTGANLPMPQPHISKIPWSMELPRATTSGLGGMCMLLGWSQTPTPGEHEGHSPIHGRTCQSPTPAAQWLVGKLTKFPFKRVCRDHYSKRVLITCQAWRPSPCPQRVGGTIPSWQMWSPECLNDSMEFSTAPGSGELRADLTWLKGRSDSLLHGRSSLLVISQNNCCKSWILNFLERVEDGQSSALIGCSSSILSPESLILFTDTLCWPPLCLNG